MLAEKVPVGRVRPELGRLLNEFGEQAVIASVYIVVAKLSFSFASINPSATPIWPTAGFALASLVLLDYRIAPAIFAGSFVANATTAGSLFNSLGIAAGNTLEGLVTAFILNKLAEGREAFERPLRVGEFAAICFMPGSMIAATIGVGSLTFGGYAEWPDFRYIWTTWWMGDSAGMLVIAPALVLWGREWRRFLEPGEATRSLCLYAFTVLIGMLAFSPMIHQTPNRTPLAFLAVLPLMWAAVRRNKRDTATAAVLLSGFAVWGTMMNEGPFASGNVNEAHLLLLAFMIATTVPSLALSAEVAERRRHEEHVDFVLHELSHRSKNLLAIVQSMANQVARRSSNFETFFAGFSTRLRALAEIHDVLVAGDWRGADIRELVRSQLVPFHDGSGKTIVASGPELRLTPKAAEQIGLALHELGTNAAKHGALSTAEGTVRIDWMVEHTGTPEERLRLSWEEVGGPPVRHPPHHGFGSLVITKVVPASLQGTASLDFAAKGVKWLLVVPSASVLVDGSGMTTIKPEPAPVSEIPAAAEEQLAGLPGV